MKGSCEKCGSACEVHESGLKTPLVGVDIMREIALAFVGGIEELSNGMCLIPFKKLSNLKRERLEAIAKVDELEKFIKANAGFLEADHES